MQREPSRQFVSELNRELSVLEDTLDEMIELLNPGGRICVITFHSLEDRIVKTIFKRNEDPLHLPTRISSLYLWEEIKRKGHQSQTDSPYRRGNGT